MGNDEFTYAQTHKPFCPINEERIAELANEVASGSLTDAIRQAAIEAAAAQRLNDVRRIVEVSSRFLMDGEKDKADEASAAMQEVQKQYGTFYVKK